MAVTERDQITLKALHRYKRLNVPQMADLTGVSRDIMRGRVRAFVADGLVRSPDKQIFDKQDPETAAPVYALTIKGSAVLARLTGDASYILSVEPSFKDWNSINHHRRVSGDVIRFDKAIASQSRVRLTDLTFEHDIADPRATDPAQRYVLYQRYDGGIIGIPDAMYVLRGEGLQPRVFALEHECGSDTARDTWLFKHKAYIQMQATKRHQVLFPGTHESFRVLCVCPYRSWLDCLRKAMKTDTGDLLPGASLWLLIDVHDLNAAQGDELLTKPLFWKANGDHPVSLVPPRGILSPCEPGRGVDGGAGDEERPVK
jgi:hypothetical protein